MRVSSFVVSNYRSIETAEIALADLTCLVGPNNEGKSNLLRALSLGLSTLISPERLHRRIGLRRRGLRYEKIGYDAEMDRPVGKGNRALTTITIRLQLTESECSDFQRIVGHSLNGELPAQVQFTLRGEPSIQYKKQRVGSSLTEKSSQIGEFLRSRLNFQYVPPIRTADDAANVIDSLVRDRLLVLYSDAEYANAMTVINSKIADVLSAVERDLQDVLPTFLPSVKSVHLESEPRGLPLGVDFGLRSILIDDGVSTELSAKGSGVQSLAALALLRHGGRTSDGLRNSILALEEPEAHLHSGALYQLKPLLTEIAREQQLIFTTHSGVLVPTSANASVVVVRNNRANQVTSLLDVREALGIRLSDNLQSARLVVVVEGENDVRFWKSVLPEIVDRLKSHIDSGIVAFEEMHGADNLPYKLRNLRLAACDAYVVCDADRAGRSTINKALKAGEIETKDYRLVPANGADEAEIEDLLDPDWTSLILERHFGIPVTLRESGKKWTDRLRSALKSVGKSNELESTHGAKKAIFIEFSNDPLAALSSAGVQFVSEIGLALLSRL